MVMGEIRPEEPTLVRVHMQDVLSDLVDARTEGHHLPLRKALQKVAQEGKGVVVILRQQETANTLVNQVRTYHMPEETDVPADRGPGELRTYGIGAQIIADVGVQKMRVMSAPKIVHGIAGFGLEVVGYES
jgi:3,4-dihydroxy 2-butanone 4-phosphate synthase/GTP cyclohydrolase II